MDRVHIFQKINDKYDEIFKEGLVEGKLPMRTTDFGFWGAASPLVMFQFFEQINLGKYKKFLDLGSGDGRVVLLASLFTDSSGVEGDEELINQSHRLKKEMKVNAKFHCEDYMDHNLSEYDCIFINPDKGFSPEFERKLSEEFEGDLFVYNQIYLPSKMNKKETTWVSEFPITRYRGKDDS